MNFPAPAVYILALALTLAIEAPVYAVGLGATEPPRPGWGARGRIGLGVNLVSHPIAFLAVYPMLAPATGALFALVAVEIGVVYLEAALVWQRRRAEPAAAFVVSCVANLASLAIGLAVLR